MSETNSKSKQGKKRAPNGAGMLRKRGRGWEYRITDGFQDNGSPRRISFYAATQKEVLKKAEEYRLLKHNGIDLTRNYDFSAWADIWFDSHQHNIRPSTRDGYRYTLRILKRYFANRPLRTISPMDVESLLKTLQADGRSPSGLAQCRGMMHQIMNKAEANNLIARNPVPLAEKLRHRGPIQEKEAFTSEEVTRMMRELPADKIGVSIRLMLGTGMRTQEILALAPKCIAEDGSLIQIRQAVNMVKGTVTVGQPKSHASSRDVPIPEGLRWCALALRATDDKYVWESPRIAGQPVNPSYFRSLFRKALESVPGVRLLSPHSCRHTYVTLQESLGVSLEVLRTLVGHSNLDMSRHYLHVQLESKFRAAELFNKAFLMNTDTEAA